MGENEFKFFLNCAFSGKIVRKRAKDVLCQKKVVFLQSNYEGVIGDRGRDYCQQIAGL